VWMLRWMLLLFVLEVGRKSKLGLRVCVEQASCFDAGEVAVAAVGISGDQRLRLDRSVQRSLDLGWF
jgi:hypothetical protein